jgi:hypothetical protein
MKTRPRRELLRTSLASIVILAAAMTSMAGCGKDELIDPPPISPQLRSGLEDWFAEHAEDPEAYVIGLFDEHDVVMLGEMHRFRHDELLVRKLIPRLNEIGVKRIATEFARRAEQHLLDSLVTSPAWNEQLGREIIFRMFMPWGYREYLDIFEAVWRVNAASSDESDPFRIIGVNNTLDYSHFKSEADWSDPEVWKLVAGDQTEADWAVPVLEEVELGKKVLVHCGIHHAFTRFRQPRVRDGKFEGEGTKRFGNFLYDTLGNGIVTVFLHAPWNTSAGYNAEYVHPADGMLDAFMLGREEGPFPVGFDTADSPLADIVIENAVYEHGHEPFTITDFCDGWIYTKPVSEYEPVTYIEDWINERNADRARSQAMNPKWREFTVEQLNEGCRSYIDDFNRFYGRLR